MINSNCSWHVLGMHVSFEFDKEFWGASTRSLSDDEETVLLAELFLSLERMFGGRSFDRALKAKELFRFRDYVHSHLNPVKMQK